MIKLKTTLAVLTVYLSIMQITTFSLSLHNEVMEFISTQPTKTQFKLWHYAYKRNYDINSELGLKKYKAFKENIKFIKSENERQTDYKLGLGPFTDLTWEEFESTMLTAYANGAEQYDPKRKLDWFDDMVDAEEKNESNNLKSSKVSKDWSYLYNYVSSQGDCGSCWAFAAVGMLEGHAIINNLQHTRFSPQYLIDCDEVSNGCDGGFLEEALIQVKDQGMMLEADYKYTEKQAMCKYKKKKVAITSLFDHCGHESYICDDEKIMEFLERGPYASHILANQAMQHYKQGNIAPKNCNTINHAIVVVQVDLEKGLVKIRNSWGPTWGEAGYGYVKLSDHTGFRGCGTLDWAWIADEMKVNPDYKP